jgi:hypothetical protein
LVFVGVDFWWHDLMHRAVDGLQPLDVEGL